MRALLLLLVLAGLLGAASGAARAGRASGAETGFLFRSVTVGGQEFKYAVYVPRDCDASRTWPLVTFLHGSGECGRDGQKQLAVGLAPAILTHGDRWPCIVVFPQKPEQSKQWEDYDAAVTAMMDAAEKEWKIDKDRESLTGLSQGGHGTWAIGALHAARFSALAPVCGYGEPGPIAEKIKGLPIWAFHGEADQAVPVEQSRVLVAAAKDHGADARLTTYPEVGHNSWDKAYAEPEFAPWLLGRKRTK
jgi:predicted peptidase